MELDYKERILAERAKQTATQEAQPVIQEMDGFQDNDASQDGLTEYQAYRERVEGSHSLMNGIIYETAKGEQRHLSVSNYREGILTHHTLLSLVYHHCIIDLKGRNLDKLLKNINRKDIEHIIEFHGKKHQELPDDTPLPVIEHMEIKDKGV